MSRRSSGTDGVLVKVTLLASLLLASPTEAHAHGISIGLLLGAFAMGLALLIAVTVVPYLLFYFVSGTFGFRFPARAAALAWLTTAALVVALPSRVLPFSVRVHVATMIPGFERNAFRTVDVPRLLHAKGTHEDPDVQRSAERALASLGIDAVEELTAALRNPKDVVRYQAAIVLAETNAPASKAASRVCAALNVESHSDVQLAELRYLVDAARNGERQGWAAEASTVAVSLLANAPSTAAAAADLLAALAADAAPALPQLALERDLAKGADASELANHLTVAIRSICRSLGDRARDDPTCREVPAAGL
jgi:hypothetical protein